MPIRITEYSNGPRGTWAFVDVVRKSDRLTFARGWTIPLPATSGGFALLRRMNWLATSFWLATAFALIASTTCAAVLESCPVAFVPRSTSRSLPTMLTVSGAFGTAGWRNSAVMSLPPSWPHAREVSTTALSWPRRVFGVTPVPKAPDIVAWARRW